MSNGQNPYPPGYPAPAGYPQMQPQQAPTQPMQPMQPMPGYPAQPTQPLPQAQPPSVGLPAIHQPDEAYTQAEYERVRAEAARWGSSGGLPFLKFLGPQGETDWRRVPVNYEAKILVYICPPWAPGKTIFKQVKSHFWKSQSNPNGTSIGCPGPERCLICQAKEAALSHPDEGVQKRAKDFGRVRKQYLYNVIALENLNGHYDQESGQWRPFILGAGAKLHGAIGDLVQERGGAMAIVDPMRGRPVKLKRRKTGPEPMNVDYSAVDMDPSPLPQQFYGVLHNLHDLDRQERVPTHEDMVKAVMDMGLPLPAQHPGGFQQAPPPAYPNPYGQPPAQVGAQQAPTFMPPPADPMEFPPGSSGPAPGYGVPQMPPPQMPQTQMAPPPQMSPPPVQSMPGAQGAPYGMQAGQMVPPPPAVTPPPGVVPERQPVNVSAAAVHPQTLAFPLPPGTTLPDGRERCFGKYNEGDRMCQECPGWVKSQCQPIAGAQAQPTAGQAQDLAQLQSQLTGGQGK